MPPHLFLLAAVGASLAAGYRLAHWSLKQREKEAERRRAEAEKREADKVRDLGNLTVDPETGEYRPQG